MILAAMLACTSEPIALVVREPELQIAPPVLAFGPVGLLSPATQNLIVGNQGRADLTLELSLDREDAVFEVPIPADPWVLEPGEEQLLPITFGPDTFRRYSAQLRFDSNDPERPTVWIPLRGEGANVPYPDIAVSSRTVEFDGAGIEALEVRNDGDELLLVSNLSFEGDPAFSLAVDPLADAESIPVAPGSSTTLLVDYEPPDPDGEFADLFIESNDPDENPLQVRLLGNGGGDFDRPVAVISNCPGAFSIAGPRTLTLDGTTSSDPGGFEPLRYRWTVLGRPDGSDPDIPLDPANQATADLYVDVAGPWAIELVVINELDTESDPVVCAFGAQPEDDLYVELSWNTSNADMDLHLIEGSSAAIFQLPEDCNYCNPNPNWGAPGGDDDPRLDIDDLGGFGPENINIRSPRPGVYQVKVHYFRRRGDDLVNAQIRLWYRYADELRTETLTRQMDFDEVWDVGTLDMATGIWSAPALANRDNPGPRECFEP